MRPGVWAQDREAIRNTMEYYTLLLLGFVVGIQHALEADHLAAVAAMGAGRTSRRALVLRGSFWGVGHTTTLLLICGMLLVLGETISPRVETWLELGVGAMVMLLGVKVLTRLWRERPHFHVHQHDDGVRHVHVHTHVGDEVTHPQSRHHHNHRNLGLGRALVVGMMHGAAGSAGLLVLAAAASSALDGIGYVLAFGVGSILGMAALSFVASYPLGFLERCAPWVNAATAGAIGCAAMFIGGHLVTASWGAL